MKAAIYARVSTKDKGQDVETQLMQLRRYCQSQNWEMVEYIDHESGKHSDRAQLQAMFAAATRREFGVVLVWALDRLSREGILATLQHLALLDANGVVFESLTEPQFRFSGPYGPIFRDLTISMAATFARMERERISDRTKAGLDRARRQGKQLGRRRKVFDRAKAEQLRKKGHSWRETARAVGVPLSTLREALGGVRKTSSQEVGPRNANKRLT